MADLTPYTRTWPERLADGAPFLGLLAGIDATVWWYDGSTTVAWITGVIVATLLVAAGVTQSGRYRRQRDTYRRSLVALTRHCAEDQAEHYFADVVPAEILAEVFDPDRKETGNA